MNYCLYAYIFSAVRLICQGSPFAGVNRPGTLVPGPQGQRTSICLINVWIPFTNCPRFVESGAFFSSISP